MRRWLAAHREGLLLALILATGAALRLYGLDWDGGHWLHPDERQIYFVALGLGRPASLSEALSPASPLNPGFFAYGSLPIYLVRLVAGLLAPISPLLRDPDNLHLVGRPLAVLFDLGAIFLTYRLVRRLEVGDWGSGRRSGAALLAAGLVTCAVLQVQLAHFYTADTLLTFFVMLALNLAADVAQGAGRCPQIGLGAAVGLALATKVSAFPLLLLIPTAFGLQRSAVSQQQTLSTTHYLLPTALTLAATGLTFFLAQPYTLIDWPTFFADTTRESQIAWGILDAPYTRQYAGTLPYLFSLWQTALWGLGLPLGLAAWTGLASGLVRWLRRGAWGDTLLLAWAGPYFALTGLLHTRYPRYMLPLVPILCILAVSSRPSAVSRRRVLGIGYWVLLICAFAYSLVFTSIYAMPHPWISASEWIYRHVPAGSTLAVEDWDTALPLPLDVDGQARRIEEYDVRLLTLYDEPDDAAKWAALSGELAAADYVIIASRRAYGALSRLPERYPLTGRYYDLLFAGELGFELAGEFRRGPAWLNPRSPAWLQPDESFVVYDHPRTLLFRNVEHLPAAAILQRVSDFHYRTLFSQ